MIYSEIHMHNWYLRFKTWNNKDSLSPTALYKHKKALAEIAEILIMVQIREDVKTISMGYTRKRIKS